MTLQAIIQPFYKIRLIHNLFLISLMILHLIISNYHFQNHHHYYRYKSILLGLYLNQLKHTLKKNLGIHILIYHLMDHFKTALMLEL